MMMVAGFYIHPAEKSHFFVIYYRCVTLADGIKPPLCKGRWPSDSEVGGIVNPPVCFADSPLYTRGPFVAFFQSV